MKKLHELFTQLSSSVDALLKPLDAFYKSHAEWVKESRNLYIELGKSRAQAEASEQRVTQRIDGLISQLDALTKLLHASGPSLPAQSSSTANPSRPLPPAAPTRLVTDEARTLRSEFRSFESEVLHRLDALEKKRAKDQNDQEDQDRR